MRKLYKRVLPVLVPVTILFVSVFCIRLFKKPLIDNKSFSNSIYDRNEKLLRLTLSYDDKYRVQTAFDDYGENVVEAFLLREDRFFKYHPGINPLSLFRAFFQSYFPQSERKIGGSTITMQLARLKYGLRTRTIYGKLNQIFHALKLELIYSKTEILQAYLSLIPFGGNIEGVGAASLVFFGKKPKELNLSEILSLAVIPQNPNKRLKELSGNFDFKSTGFFTLRKSIFEKWVKKYPKDSLYESAIESRQKIYSTKDLPFNAPHFVERILPHIGRKTSVITSIDLKYQRALERKVTNYLEPIKSFGIRNACAMIIDGRSMEIIALLGSADYFNDSIDGQVNGTRAKRSPGSTLKPFIYALSMEEGLVHTLSVLKDSPMSFGAFNPENFDNDFKGPISVSEALIHSRNIPAVYMNSLLSDNSLYDFLKISGVTGLHSPGYYGLALTLGGAEMTMEELAVLYGIIANSGRLRNLNFFKADDEKREGTQVLSPQSVYMVRDILSKNPRPSQKYRSEWTLDSSDIAWKTGTSFGFRDAWTAGIAGPYIVLVWVGNFSGEENRAFIGRQVAAPLFFEIADALRAIDGKLHFPNRYPPSELIKVEICPLSGKIAGKHCKKKVTTWFMPGISPIQKCDVHREIMIDQVTGLRSCTPDKGLVAPAVYEFWPSDLLKIFRQAGVPRRVAPPFNPGCALEVLASIGTPPEIVSPAKDISYNLRASRSGAQTIPLQAVIEGGVKNVYWFVGNEFVSKASADQTIFWKARPGNFVVRIIDDLGRSDSRQLLVKAVK